ncbi:insulinase family protein [Tsuneonella sp. YG55]|uniref:Insulinase family protein n=1 Tax=Tsuneonella litorea TaxID=2976475 RepID=A0A9X2VZQ2_9SPHN|nr:pitrilysin family protein [Tsuneonella litorea]MCT2557396.1 insulinase family protein [Tsuneonella litorea]
MYRSFLAGGAAFTALVSVMPALAADPAPPAPAAVSAPKIAFTEWTLANGLRVIALPDPTTASVTTSVWYEVGSKHDPEGRSGFAHLFEHILSRKTENMPYNMINRLTEDVGGQRNASTGDDRTNYYETVPAEYLETMLWTHAERMARPVVDDEVFEKERSIVKEELRQRILAPPYGRIRLVIAENAYDVLPNRRPGIGSLEQLDSATLADARAFHQAYYGPDTATLIVAGNVDIARLRALVDRYFASIPRRAAPIPLEIAAREPQRTSPRSIVATAPNVPLPVTGLLWKVPPVDHPDMAALEVFDAVMSSGDNSRLYEALVRTGKAVSVSEALGTNEDGGYLAAFAILNPAADKAEVAEILANQIAAVRDAPVTEAELAEAKNTLFASALRRRETVRGRAFELGEALVSTGDPRAADLRLEQIGRVTAADVQRVAQTWLRPEAAVAWRYEAGEDNPASYANPVPMPTFASVPPATGEPAQLKDEATRQAPPPPGAKPPVEMARLVEDRLANGIPLVSAQTGDVPIATITLVLPGGSATDPAGKAGLAALAAAVADKGTPTRSAKQIAEELESLGASLGAGTADDGNFVSLTAPTANLAAAGKVLADVVRNASFPAGEVELERKRTIDSLAVAMKDPGSLAGMVATRLLYGDAPYGGIATVASLPAITPDDLVAWRKAHWHPASAKIVVSGGISPAQAKSVTDGLFGDWTSDAPAPVPVANPAGADQPVRTVVIDMPEAGQAAVLVGTRVISRGSDRYWPLQIANAVLGSGSNGRLFEEVRTKRGLSYGAYSGFGATADTAVLTASAQTKNETADEVVEVMLDQFDRIGNDPLDADTVEKRRLYIGGSVQRSLETSAGFNGIVANLMLQGIAPTESGMIAQRLAAVTPEAAQAVAKALLPADKATVVVVGNAATFLDDLRKIRPNVTVIEAKDLDLDSPTLAAAGG